MPVRGRPLVSFRQVDAPIPVKRSSGVEPLAVIAREGVVALMSAFEPRDGDDRDAKVMGAGGQGEFFGLPGRPEVVVVVDWAGTGKQSENFAGDGSFE